MSKLLCAALTALIVAGCASHRPAQVAVTPATRPTTAPAAHAAAPVVLAANTVVTRDIVYAANAVEPPRQSLNVYAPGDAKSAPVVVFVHGGGWRRGDRADVGAQPRLFNEAGIILVSVDYRLSPKYIYPAHTDDVAAAVAWTKANIAKYGGDPNRIVVMGHSAGCQMAAQIAVDPRPLAKVSSKPADVKGVIILDGSVMDIPDRIAKGGEKLAENCRRAFGPDPKVHADASPINHVQPGRQYPPFLLVYVKDGSLSHEQLKAFGRKLNDVGGKAQLAFMEGKTHASLVADLGAANDTAGPQLVGFIQSVVATPASP